MKKLSTIGLCLFSISILMSACGKKKDYTCVCIFNGQETETAVMPNTTKAQAKIACDALETYADLECELK